MNPTSDSARLRTGLADWIAGRGTFRTPAVEAAFRTVRRELFLPGIPPEVAYGRGPVVTRRDRSGAPVSSASAPNLVATMLEQLDVRPGQTILEIGAATGVNAALLAELTGPGGRVVTIEYDPDLAASAAAHLTAAGYPNVTVVAGDGALGHPACAPYDRIIVTAEAGDLPAAFWDQLAPDGRIVVPLRLHGSGLTRSLAFDRTAADRLVAHGAVVCGFVPMRGSAAAHPDNRVVVTDEVTLLVDATDQRAPADAFTHDRHERWTGITSRYDDDAADHLDLWLLTHAGDHFARLTVTATARATGIDPARRWGGATLHDGTTVAYLITRDLDADTAELGIAACGPHHAALSATTADLLTAWHQSRPGQPTVTAHRTGPVAAVTAPYLHRLTVSW